MSGRNCELCNNKLATESIYDIELCEECFNGYMGVLQGDFEKIEKYSELKNFPYASDRAKEQIIELACLEYQKFGGIVEEVKHQNYANSFKEFYEYDVVTILNENHGQVNKAKMKQILCEYARKGWKLHTLYSNELGKNAIAFLGLGVNSTACEDVLVFERRVEHLN